MTALYPRKDDTLTARNIVDSFMAAYSSVHDARPDCQYLDGERLFVVNGQVRDRRWMLLEVERLRQEALTRAFDDHELQQKPASNLFRLIRRLSKL
ncbi:MAG: hypothetical protein HC915_04245 [Anaerolineae bacterium]|nr:hypothetical protein [Anaerolineae bacterium]